jgi:hypothetical protein
MSTPACTHAALAHPVFTGISRQHLGELIVELADHGPSATKVPCSSVAATLVGMPLGPAPTHRLVSDRVLVSLVILRFQLPHQALGALYGVDRSTITRAVHEIRPLLAARGFAVPDRPGVRLHTLADVFVYAAAAGVELRVDGTETQVRRPRANLPGRRAFVSGKRKRDAASDLGAERFEDLGGVAVGLDVVPGPLDMTLLIDQEGRPQHPDAGLENDCN